MNLYADDTAIYASDEDPAVGFELEQDLQRVANWISTNGLGINISKTKLMVLSSKKKQWLADSVHVSIGEGELLRQDSVKYLGVNIDRSLSWKSHIDRV